MFRLYSQTCLFFDQARLDQCKVTMEALEKQLEEEKQKVLNTESQRGAATGKRPGSSRKKKNHSRVCCCYSEDHCTSAVATGYMKRMWSGSAV